MSTVNKKFILIFEFVLCIFILFAIGNPECLLQGECVASTRAILNVDIIIAGIVLGFNRWLGVLLIAALVACNLVVSQAALYMFDSPLSFIESFVYYQQIDILKLISHVYLVPLLALVFLIATLFILIKDLRSLPLLVSTLFIILLLSMLDIFNGSSGLFQRDRVNIQANILGSPTLGLLRRFFVNDTTATLNSNVYNESVIGKFDVVAWAKNNSDRAIVFVIVESLGVPAKHSTREYFHGILKKAGYKSIYLELPSSGATTNGELRSLCGLSGRYRMLHVDSIDQCLPIQLSNMGWSTFALHGFSKDMFNRKVWWPKIGIGQSIFIEDLPLSSMPVCGSIFKGVCDIDLIDFSIKTFAKPKSFLYILTLNTHLPVIPKTVTESISNYCIKDDLSDTVCMHMSNLFDVLENVMSTVSKLPKKPLVIIVGDHPPPFLNKLDRGSFRDSVVPAYIFTPD